MQTGKVKKQVSKDYVKKTAHKIRVIAQKNRAVTYNFHAAKSTV